MSNKLKNNFYIIEHNDKTSLSAYKSEANPQNSVIQLNDEKSNFESENFDKENQIYIINNEKLEKFENFTKPKLQVKSQNIKNIFDSPQKKINTIHQVQTQSPRKFERESTQPTSDNKKNPLQFKSFNKKNSKAIENSNNIKIIFSQNQEAENSCNFNGNLNEHLSQSRNKIDTSDSDSLKVDQKKFDSKKFILEGYDNEKIMNEIKKINNQKRQAIDKIRNQTVIYESNIKNLSNLKDETNIRLYPYKGDYHIWEKLDLFQVQSKNFRVIKFDLFLLFKVFLCM